MELLTKLGNQTSKCLFNNGYLSANLEYNNKLINAQYNFLKIIKNKSTCCVRNFKANWDFMSPTPRCNDCI